MPKKGEAYNCPPKRFWTPPDIKALGTYATMLAGALRATWQHRMSDTNLRKLGTGKGVQSKRGRPGKKKG